MSSRTAAVAALLAVSVALLGCGRKGDPEFPQGTQTEKVKPDPYKEGEKEKKRPVPPKRPFVLDGLLN